MSERGLRRTAAFTPAIYHGGAKPLGVLRGGVAAVEVDRLAGHEIRGGRGQVDGQRADLLRAPAPAGGDVAEQAVGQPVVAAIEGGGGHVRLEPARRDRVDL